MQYPIIIYRCFKPIKDHTLPVDLWPHFHLSEVRGQRTSDQFRGYIFSICRVLQPLLAFETEITTTYQQLSKFLTMLGWHQFHTLDDNSFFTGDRKSVAFNIIISRHHTLNFVTKGPDSFKFIMDIIVC